MNLRRIKYISIISLGLIGCGGGSNASSSNSASEPINTAPIADFSFDCTGLECRFESTSSDSDGEIDSIEWKFGNDQESTSSSDTVLYDEFVDYSVSLTVTDDDGQSSSLTKTVTPSKKVELNAGIDWEAYSSELNKYSSYYGNLPVSLNSRETWFSTLQIPLSHFTSSEVTFTSEEKPQHGVGYGTWANISANHQLVFYANWAPGEPNSGSAMVLEYEGGEPVSLEVKRIEGSTSPSVMQNSDGSRQVIFPGVDEGKISIDAGAAAPSYTYNLETRSWKDIGVTLGAHNSIIFDYQRDGDDDLLAQNWLYGDFGGNPVILENNSGELTPIKVQSWGYIPGMMGVAPFYFEDNKLAIIYTDASVDEQFDIAPETNVIAYYSRDLLRVEQVLQLPTPYFERPVFSDLSQNIEEWEGNVGLSHDVAAKSIDIDADGDRDIIISSMIFSGEYPYSVPQILVNNGGVYVDETDERLFNWLLTSGAAHRMHFVDVNGDDHTDILISDHGRATFPGSESIDHALTRSARILVNDGTGHFVTIAHQQINADEGYYPSRVPSVSADGKLRWTTMDPNGSEDVRVLTRQLNVELHTGPNGVDPSKWGEPDFNEFYYLLHNEEARQAVAQGEYNNGLEHYLFVGKSQDLVTHR